MGASIHPHKGYLNTKFYVHVTGQEKEYFVYQKDDCDKHPITTGIAKPNEPHVLDTTQPGDFVVSFTNGDEINFHIEDGYKFGGSSYKTSFIFDKCPWCFVVMHDRTYFYNRETKIAYVEPISPDNITEINKDYVIFENEEQEERTIFSLIEEKPILCISDIVTFNESVVVWQEKNDNQNELCVYVLGTGIDTIDRFEFDGYVIDNEHDNIIFYYGKTIKKFSLSEYNGSTTYQITIRGILVNMVAPNLAVSYRKLDNELIIRNLDKDEETTITLDGHLAEINGKELIDIWHRQEQISEFDFSVVDVPELTLSALYNKVYIYPCEWNIFYSVETISLEKECDKSVKKTSTTKFHSVNTGEEIDIKQAKGKFTTKGEAVCFYNEQESFVRCKNDSGDGYIEGGKVYVQDKNIYLYKDSNLYKLSSSGCWNNPREIDLDFSYFDEFGIVKDKLTRVYQNLDGTTFGKFICANYQGKKWLQTSEYYIFSNANILLNNTKLSVPPYLSDSLRHGLKESSEGIYLCELKGPYYTSRRIMKDIYDSTEYHDVLLSEDGNCFMYRDEDKAIIFDIGMGFSQTFDNLSYIKHINGIRPLFSTPASLQPILVNPVTKQRIDATEMSDYQFVSPDGKLYADTRLNKYIERYYKETGTVISNDEFKKLREKYTYPSNKKDSTTWNIVTENRKQLILENFEYLNKKYPKLFKEDLTGNKWVHYVLDKKNEYGVAYFLGLLFGERGIAVIRNSYDNSEYTRINLGSPLMFINYVSFSYDSKYVAIAGYRNGGGLFMVYDLETKNNIVHKDTSRAVWNVAFSACNALASYTSNPKTLFAANEEEYVNMCDEKRIIEGCNFLTFSPDGGYFALSKQGYISKYDRNGNVRYNWGHQPSSLVEIRKTLAKDDTLIEYNDLSDSGISETSCRESVASVSFSNDNKRLMMVGNDGVVIIRNLHLEDYAGK